PTRPFPSSHRLCSRFGDFDQMGGVAPRREEEDMSRFSLLAATCVLLLMGVTSSGRAGSGPSYTRFESGPVRPLALSSDGKKLYAVNTPDARLEIFSVHSGYLTHIGSAAVGLEPVAIALRNDNEAWVVNHLSDSISIVDVTPNKFAR